MADATKVLGEDDARIYGNVRTIAVLFVLLGGILAFAGVTVLIGDRPPTNTRDNLPPIAAEGIGLAGAFGFLGGIAILSRKRRLVPFSYGLAVLYVFAFPLGTILSLYLLQKLPRYQAILEVLEKAANQDPTDQVPPPLARG
jgi:drug/metabolite transporter (DMT)-like permease